MISSRLLKDLYMNDGNITASKITNQLRNIMPY